MVEGVLPESQGQNLALTVLHVPSSLESAPPGVLTKTTIPRVAALGAGSPGGTQWRRGLLSVNARVLARNFEGAVTSPLSSEEGTTSWGDDILPESQGLDCFTCAEFARERPLGRLRSSSPSA